MSHLNFPSTTAKEAVFTAVLDHLTDLGFRITHREDSRPWGGFYYIDETQASDFIRLFFPRLDPAAFAGFSKLSPKILIVAPTARLSWQYHHRRSEIWTVIGGNAAIVISDTDEPTPEQPLPFGSFVRLAQGERHRLVGVTEWGIIAEIWQHTDASHPSDEDDIVRVQDDFGR